LSLVVISIPEKDKTILRELAQEVADIDTRILSFGTRQEIFKNVKGGKDG